MYSEKDLEKIVKQYRKIIEPTKINEIRDLEIQDKPITLAKKFFKTIARHKTLIEETDEKEYLSTVIIKLDALIMNLEGKLPNG